MGHGRGGNSSVGRASAFQAEGRGFESRFPLHSALYRSAAHVAQAVEHFLGKEEVTGSIPVVSSDLALKYGGRRSASVRAKGAVSLRRSGPKPEEIESEQ